MRSPSRFPVWLLAVVALLLVAAWLASTWLNAREDERDPQTALRMQQLVMGVYRGAVRPLPRSAPVAPEKLALGRKLFNDAKLSGDGSRSCAGCHPLDKGGSDHLAHPVGQQGNDGNLKTPSIFNTAFNYAHFSDGRALALEDQVRVSLTDPVQNGAALEDVLKYLKGNPGYRADFTRIYQHAPDQAAVIDALASFERTLITPDSRFDRYLRGDPTALNAAQQRGYERFQSYGCISCHQGINLGGNMNAKLGVMNDYFAGREDIRRVDFGRFNLTGAAEDRHYFRVPSLRNVALNAPYFHDGSVPTLRHAVQLMSYYQLGRDIRGQDLEDILSFLETLNGDYQNAQTD